LVDESGCPGWSLVDGLEEDIAWSHGEINEEVKGEVGKGLGHLVRRDGALLYGKDWISSTLSTRRHAQLYRESHGTPSLRLAV
jgi:hypothetical protein